MSYSRWFQTHGEKHKAIMDKLTELSHEEVIDYFSFENMVKEEPDFCPLYKDNKKCHDIEDLNCYLCACPNFRVGELKSSCAINSKYGDNIVAKDGYIHQDCSACVVPHSTIYTKKVFDKNWQKIMQNTF